jgi:hypothetical protein
MIRKAGPGNTSIAIPINSTVNPMTPTISFFACLMSSGIPHPIVPFT